MKIKLEFARTSIIKYVIIDRNWKDESKWNELYKEMIDTMIRFEEALKDFLKLYGNRRLWRFLKKLQNLNILYGLKTRGWCMV